MCGYVYTYLTVMKNEGEIKTTRTFLQIFFGMPNP